LRLRPLQEVRADVLVWDWHVRTDLGVDIIVVDRAKWETQRSFASGHNGDITDFAWSPNGAFLASAGSDGKLVIWETRTQTILTR
jgi:WD40 repeat protein